MLQLLQPIALIAIAGILIPLVIHLWNIKQGKTLQVGSIALLKENAKQNAKSLQLTDLLLLIIRCLLLMVLALMLAKPLWDQLAKNSKTKGWILMEGNQIGPAYSSFKSEIDSLLQAGYELHSFTPSFPAMQLEDSTELKAQSSTSRSLSYWSLLKALETDFAPGFPIHLYTENSLNRFAGQQPGLSLDLNWNTFPAADSSKQWITNAYLTTTDSLRIIEATSSATITAITATNLIPIENADSKYNFTIQNGAPFIKLSADSTRIPVDTAVHITIFTGEYKQDAAYLAAAIHTLQNYTQRKLELSSVEEPAQIPANTKLLFWLSDHPVPDSLMNHLEKGSVIFQYKTGEVENIAMGTLLQPSLFFSEEKLELYQRVRPEVTNGNTIWSDGFGNPLLAQENSGYGDIYNLYTHFNPAWNNLVWSEQFIPWMMPIILQAEPDDRQFGFESNHHDLREISTQQKQPILYEKDNEQGLKPVTARTDLNPFLWIAAFILFMMERILAGTKKKA